jgi:hypothetical protein
VLPLLHSSYPEQAFWVARVVHRMATRRHEPHRFELELLCVLAANAVVMLYASDLAGLTRTVWHEPFD